MAARHGAFVRNAESTDSCLATCRISVSHVVVLQIVMRQVRATCTQLHYTTLTCACVTLSVVCWTTHAGPFTCQEGLSTTIARKI